MEGLGHGKPHETEARHIITAEPMLHDIGRAGILHRYGAEAIEAQHVLAVFVIDSKKCLGTAGIMTFSGMLPQEIVQSGFAAIERLAVVLLADRLPCQGGSLICAWAAL